MRDRGGTGNPLRERRTRAGPFPVLRLSEWEASYPGLVVGTTALEAMPVGQVRGSGPEGERLDFRLTSSDGGSELVRRYRDLARHMGFTDAAVARQVHGASVAWVDRVRADGIVMPGKVDGLISEHPGVLLAITTADCVPVYLIEPDRRLTCLVHAGWRGIAAGVLRRAVNEIEAGVGAGAGDLLMHLGPAICGRCYEVGAEVLAALGHEGSDAQLVDLRSELEDRAIRLGLRPDRISRSGLCTRCGPEPLHSHRRQGGGCGRQAAFVGWSVR